MRKRHETHSITTALPLLRRSVPKKSQEERLGKGVETSALQSNKSFALLMMMVDMNGLDIQAKESVRIKRVTRIKSKAISRYPLILKPSMHVGITEEGARGEAMCTVNSRDLSMVFNDFIKHF